ncbi:uncharacterized protein LAESUDRAFT_360381, partial [Laetiporus sulphureus 93-53]
MTTPPSTPAPTLAPARPPAPPAPQPSTPMSTSTKQPSGSNRLFDIPSLENEGGNYQQWKFRVETVLRIRKLWDITQGQETRPADSEPA